MTRPRFSPIGMEWMRSHGIDPAVAVKVGVEDDHGCLRFPVRTRTGQSFTRTRRLPGPCLQPRGVTLAPWWLEGHRAAEHVLAVEGEGDGLAALTARVHSPAESTIHRLAIVVLPGAGVAHEVLVGDLQHHGVKAVVLALDADQAGRAATRKLGNRIIQVGIRVFTAPIPDGLDLADLLARSNDPAATFSELISAVEHYVPTEPPAPARKPRQRPYRASGGVQGDTFERVLDELRGIPAEEYLEHLAPESEPARGRCRCPLPHHEDRNPSASYKGTVWCCHGCGEGGDLLDLAAVITGLNLTTDFPEVVRWTADQFHIDTAPMERPTERRAA